jgi:Tfp pilus assembly protein PilF
MSYINEALRKAQKERDRSYGQFRGVIASCSEEAGQPRKRRLAVVAAVALLVLIPAGVLLAVYISEQPVSMRQDAAVTVVAQAPVMPPPVALPADQGKVAKADQAGPTQASAAATPASPPVTAQANVPLERRTEKKDSITRNKEKAANRAIEKPTASVAAVPVNKEVSPREAQAIYQEALYAQRNLDMKGAEALYKRTLALDPGHVRAMNNLGVIFMGRKKWEDAIVLFNKAIVRKKDYVDPYYNLSCLYARRNKIDDSLYYMKAAAAIDGSVIEWAKNDADMKNVVASREFKKMMEEQKN